MEIERRGEVMKQQELLARKFVEIAKKFPKKVAFIDGVSGNKITYGKTLIAALILKKKFDAYNHKKIGMMIPTSGGAIIALVAALFSGEDCGDDQLLYGDFEKLSIRQRQMRGGDHPHLQEAFGEV